MNRSSQRRGGGGYRSRALRFGSEFQPFNRLAIFDRDGWRCGICAEAVDPARRFPDPGSPSLDHVVPLSKGGSHTPENVQCSHLICNVEKGSRTPDPQLILVG